MLNFSAVIVIALSQRLHCLRGSTMLINTAEDRVTTRDCPPYQLRFTLVADFLPISTIANHS